MICSICERKCNLKEGSIGGCGRYKLVNGEMKEMYPDSYLVVCPISAETMPVMNFYPGAKF